MISSDNIAYIQNIFLGVLFLIGSSSPVLAAEVPIRQILFNNEKPGNACHNFTYGAIGIDDQDNIYLGACGECSGGAGGGNGNCSIYQYNANTEKKVSLGTFYDIAKKSGNLKPGDAFMKGHSNFPFMNGKIYMGSQGFHDSGGLVPGSRGGHIFSYNTRTQEFIDEGVEGATETGGVFSPNQGIIQLASYPEQNIIIGWTVGRGDLLLYDTQKKTTKTVEGAGGGVMREIIVTPKGKIYYANCGNGNNCSATLKEYDISTGQVRTTDYKVDGGYINALVRTKDRKTNYFATYSNLYKIDENGNFEFLKEIHPGGGALWGLSLSRDEKKLYFIPSRGQGEKKLHEYDIATGRIETLGDVGRYVGGGYVSGDEVTDSQGRVYFVYYGNGTVGLLQADVSTRTGEAPVGTGTGQEGQQQEKGGNNTEGNVQIGVLEFKKIIVDDAFVGHVKVSGDFNGDGLLDIAAGGENTSLSWYEAPNWTKHGIDAPKVDFTADGKAVDIDNDGNIDIVLGDGKGVDNLVWYKNPGGNAQGKWTRNIIGTAGSYMQDVEVSDINKDGKIDIITRRHDTPTNIWIQKSPSSWEKVSLRNNATGEGTDISDMDGDGNLDIIHNGYWMRSSGSPEKPESWERKEYAAGIPRLAVVRVADVNKDGKKDIITAPLWSNGEIAWYEAPNWTKHVVSGGMAHVNHFEPRDIDLDGDLDIVFTESHLGNKRVGFFLNTAGGTKWKLTTIDTGASHNIRVIDLGNDGDFDIVGAMDDAGRPPLQIWENQIRTGTRNTNTGGGQGTGTGNTNTGGGQGTGTGNTNTGGGTGTKNICHTFTEKTDWPEWAIKLGFAPFYNIFSPAQVIIKTFCDADMAGSIFVEVGNKNAKNMILYRQGYVFEYPFLNGQPDTSNGSWKPFSFTEGGALLDGRFYQGWAKGIATVTQNILARGTYVASYLCFEENGKYSCGCTDTNQCQDNIWNIQRVQFGTNQNVTEGQQEKEDTNTNTEKEQTQQQTEKNTQNTAHVKSEKVTLSKITFDTLRPTGACHQWTFGAFGITPKDDVYSAFCGDCGDCAIYKYSSSGQKSLVGTLRGAAKDKNEKFLKGHSRMPYMNGKLYMGTQSFHDSTGESAGAKGGHIFEIDTATDTITDLSDSQPGGVFIPKQGIIQLTTLPERNLLIGWSVGRGDIILYNTQSKNTKIIPAPAGATEGKGVMRQIPVTKDGKIYFGYCKNDAGNFYNTCEESLYVYDINSDKTTKTDFVTKGGLLNGWTQTRDRKTNYVSTYMNLYKLDEAGNFTHLSGLRDAVAKNNALWGLTLSLDEKSLYYIPSTGSGAKQLHEYNIATKKIEKILDISQEIGGQAWISGDNLRDSKGNIYFLSHHIYGNNNSSALLKIDVTGRTEGYGK